MLDPRALLGNTRFFLLFKNLMRSKAKMARYVKERVRPSAGDRILDIGCGLGDILDLIDVEVDYYGFDMSEKYIAYAKETYGHRGKFFCQLVREADLAELGTFDIVMANGVLHHLDDDETVKFFQLAARALKPGGRLVTVDGVYVPEQSVVARYLLSRDRGEHVRDREGYLSLARQVFGAVEDTVTHDRNRLPYTHLIIECTAPTLTDGESTP